MGWDHVRIVLAVLSADRPLVEKLAGPILPWAKTVEAEQARVALLTPRASARHPDLRVVLEVSPNNPHAPGTDAHRHYTLWVVGETVQAALNRGVSGKSKRRTIRAGLVQVGPPHATNRK